MTIKIHLDKEITDQTTHKIRLSAEGFYDRADRLYASVSNIQWQGNAKDDFLFELYRCTSALKSLSDSLDLLGFQLSRETEEWESISARFSR